MNQKTPSEQIVDFLKDPSFPTIVLLSGAWGSGKTYLAKEKLTPLLRRYDSKKRVHYVSAYGLTSLDDFRDKILSLCYSNNSNTSAWASSAKSIVGGATRILGDGGITNTVMGALAKPVKHKLLKAINNVNIIIDDLERASSEKLINEILGESLNFAENNTNVWIIAIANIEQIKNLQTLEKTFLNRVSINPTAVDLINFVDNKYQDLLCDVVRKTLTNTIEELQLENFRVVQRILQVYTTVQHYVNKADSIDRPNALAALIGNITRICYAHFVCGLPAKVLQAYAENKTNQADDDVYSDQSPENNSTPTELLDNEKSNILVRTMSRTPISITKSLVNYSLGLTRLPEHFIEEFNIPLLTNPIDSIINFHFMNGNMSAEYFGSAIGKTKEFIDNPQDRTYFDWIRALDAYCYLINNCYIDGNIEKIISNAREIAAKKDDFKTFNDADEIVHRYFMRNIEERLSSNEVKNLHNEIFPIIEKFDKKNKSSKLENMFIQSWDAVSSDIYRNYDYKPFLNTFNLGKVSSGIKENWSITESIIFGQHLAERYKANNIYQYLSPEFSSIKKLRVKIEEITDKMDSSIDKGKLMELLSYIETAIKAIEEAETREKLAKQATE
ncbi:KAP family NTPase [Shewanella sp. C32]|uniref:KAP family NTPase n=1 Tax=Shewanella electrica TaxID=515560 RepID=A0ABT2FK94_9GAMM|nr:AAA family ATPase [Shewanella electrica]MCH1924802.1 KAP family NTPase [Shewanella electrica]MCS4556751.1 KAP family NTPase [Shewanella electrica]